MRWYCWVIFCAVLVLSTWAFPAEDNVEEKNLVVSDNGLEQSTTSATELLGEDEDEDEDEDNNDDNGEVDITDRRFRKRKPFKKYDSSSSEDDDASPEEKHYGGKLKKFKCVCQGKKPFTYTLKAYYKPGKPPKGKPKPKPSSSTQSSDSPSQRPYGPGNQNQGGSNQNQANKDDDDDE